MSLIQQETSENTEGYQPVYNNSTLADYLFWNSNELDSNSYIFQISEAMKKMGIIKDRIDIIKEGLSQYYNIKVDGVDIRHVGIGVRYVLPILLTVLSNKDSTICIENPEIHLHPKAQTELMCVLFQYCNDNNNQLIIETHSDHIINSFRVFTKNKRISSDDIIFYFMQSGGTINKLDIDSNGKFNKNIKDFFDEYEKMLVQLL